MFPAKLLFSDAIRNGMMIQRQESLVVNGLTGSKWTGRREMDQVSTQFLQNYCFGEMLYFISDNGKDSFLEGAKKGINFVSMIQNWYHQVTIADTVFWYQPSLFARNLEMIQQIWNYKNNPKSKNCDAYKIWCKFFDIAFRAKSANEWVMVTKFIHCWLPTGSRRALISKGSTYCPHC